MFLIAVYHKNCLYIFIVENDGTSLIQANSLARPRVFCPFIALRDSSAFQSLFCFDAFALFVMA